MPLPEEVINRLSEERPPSGGWSSGLLGFSVALLVVVAALYAGIAFAYEPYLNNRIASVSTQLGHASQQVDSSQQASLIAFYSQTVHVQSLLQSHIIFSTFLEWLSKHTEVNVYYASLLFSSNNQVTLSALARTQNDLDQQLAVFESDPDITNVSVSNVTIANVSGFIQANLTLTVKPTLLMATSQ